MIHLGGGFIFYFYPYLGKTIQFEWVETTTTWRIIQSHLVSG